MCENGEDLCEFIDQLSFVLVFRFLSCFSTGNKKERGRDRRGRRRGRRRRRGRGSHRIRREYRRSVDNPRPCDTGVTRIQNVRDVKIFIPPHAIVDQNYPYKGTHSEVGDSGGVGERERRRERDRSFEQDSDWDCENEGFCMIFLSVFRGNDNV